MLVYLTFYLDLEVFAIYNNNGNQNSASMEKIQ